MTQQSNLYGLLPSMSCKIFLNLSKTKNLPLGLIQPSSPSAKELHGQGLRSKTSRHRPLGIPLTM